MIDSKESLRECPFCGSAGEVYPRKDYEWVARCTGEDCPFEVVSWFPNEASAVKMWNTRALPAPDNSKDSRCPFIVTSDEGTSYCRLAEQNGPPPMKVTHVPSVFRNLGSVGGGEDSSLAETLAFLNKIEGHGYGGMVEFETVRETVRRMVERAGEDRVTEELKQIIPNLLAWAPSLKDSESFLRLEALAGFEEPGDVD